MPGEALDPELSDALLVQATARGDRGAFSSLVSRHQARLWRCLRALTGSEQLAEEALQETFFRVWNQADRFDSARSSVSAWLVLAARDRALERLRQRRLHGRPAASSMSDRGVETLPGVHIESAAVKDRRARVQAALAGFPAEHKEVLGLILFDGLTLAGAAEQLRTPLATLKTRALRAMKQLRRDLRAEIRELM